MDQKNISGAWLGLYRYTGIVLQPASFSAQLIQQGEDISGQTQEANSFVANGPEELMGDLVGATVGADISFTKTYPAVDQPAIEYVGIVSKDGRLIEGVWYFPSYQEDKGTFKMWRKRKASVRAEQKQSVTLDM